MKIPRIRLRNKIKNFLNSDMCGCRVSSGIAPSGKKRIVAESRHYWRFVAGTAKNGKAILIYPIVSWGETMPRSVCELMMEDYKRGALVGCAMNLGDAWCIAADDEVNYKRNKRSYYFLYWNEKYKEKQDGAPPEESSDG